MAGKRIRWAAWTAGLVMAAAPAAWGQFHFKDGMDAPGAAETFGITADTAAAGWKVTLTASSAPGNIFHPGERPRFEFQVESLTDEPIGGKATIEVIRYGGRGQPGNMWVPEFHRIAKVGEIALDMDVPAKGYRDLAVSPKTPETKGGYALVLELPGRGRAVLTSYVRTFKVPSRRVQFPKQSLENMPPAILQRLGIRAIRYGVGYIPTDDSRYAERLAWLDEQFRAMHAHHVTCTVEIGAGARGEDQPLGRARPHLDANGVMKGGKSDMAWLPECDDDYERFVYLLASKYGWPKGPVTGFMLWNEPWEGLSISGWGADMIRYRTLYKRMGDAVFRARKEAGVDVLIGGCDSSTNTWDKLLPEGVERSEFWPEYLDFCSIHYQGLSSPCLYRSWNNRKHYKGRVLIWDTESWVANTDDRFAGVVATNRACGYDRSMGIRGTNVTSVLSHHRVAHDVIRTAEGTKKIVQPIVSWPVAASVGAVQHFIGERDFREILFRKGLPWVYVFHGLEGRADDGTVVVLGDVHSLFGGRGKDVLFRGVRCLDEVRARKPLRDELAKLPASAAAKRSAILDELRERMPMTGATLTLEADPAIRPFDFYGNPLPARDGKIVVPLNEKGFFLRADPAKKGSFDRLLAALKTARIDGLEPLGIIARDPVTPIDDGATLRLRLTNMRNRPISGTLDVRLAGLKLDYPRKLSFGPRQQRWIDVKITPGEPRPDNAYLLSVRFDAGEAGLAVHDELMHVNLIARRSIEVDGKLEDWKGTLPQTIRTAAAGEASFEESMWLPFVKLPPGQAGGLAMAWVARDDKAFYFAAKIADDSPHPGSLRFATRDHDAAFYPKVSYSIDMRRRMEPQLLDAVKTAKAAPRGPEGKPRGKPACWNSAGGRLGVDLDLPAGKLTRVALYVVSRDRLEFRAVDRATGKQLAKSRVGNTRDGGYVIGEMSGKVRIELLRRNDRWGESGLYGVFLDATDTKAKKSPSARFERKADTKTGPAWAGTYGAAGYALAGGPKKLPAGVEMAMPAEVVRDKHVWPEGVRRFSYRQWPMLPSSYGQSGYDNVLLGFNALAPEEKDWLTHLPGRMPRFVGYKTTDYEYALNRVAGAHGGGTEVWRLECPGMPRKHFYPRQPKHPREGAVDGAKLVVRYEAGMRIVEAALPWEEIPEVRKLAEAGKPVKFSFRVNHSERRPTMELPLGRSAAEGISSAFHPDWSPSVPNELEFGWE